MGAQFGCNQNRKWEQLFIGQSQIKSHLKPMESTVIRILLVEDNPGDAYLLKRLLKTIEFQRFNLVHVQRLSEAIAVTQQNNFDVILLDLGLPDSQGLETLRQIQQRVPDIPIVVLTGLDNQEIAVEALRAKAQDYLVKGNMQGNLLIRSIHYAIERQQILEKLSNSEARYRGVVEDQTELICRFLPDYTLTFVNESTCRYFQQEAEVLIGQSLKLLIPHSVWPKMQQSLTEICWQNPLISFEHWLQFPCEKQKWLQWTYRGLFNSKNVLIEYQAVGRDITEKKQAEEALEVQQKFLRTVIDTNPNLIFVLNTEGNFTLVNQALANFYGITLEKIIGKNIADFNENTRPTESFWSVTANVIEQLQTQIMPAVPMRNKSGELRWFHIIKTPLMGLDKIANYMLGVATDITEQKQAEKAMFLQMDRNHLLSQIAQAIHQSLNLTEILNRTVTLIHQFLMSDRVIICRYYPNYNQEETTDFLDVVAESTMPEWSSLLGNKIQDPWLHKIVTEWETSHSKEIKFLENIETTCLPPATQLIWQQQQVQSKLVLPIILSPSSRQVQDFNDILGTEPLSSQFLWGVLVVHQCDYPRQWQETELEGLQSLTTQISIAIEHGELHEQLQTAIQKLHQLATLDGLTGLANRRQFDQYLSAEWQRMKRDHKPLSLIICDVDFFKLYNDTYGHQMGDECLKSVTQGIQQCIKRPADLAARYGGEEFAVILPNTELAGALQIASQIQAQIKTLEINHARSEISNYLTLSLGVTSTIPSNHHTPEVLIKNADEALYEAKKSGRNQVRIRV